MPLSLLHITGKIYHLAFPARLGRNILVICLGKVNQPFLGVIDNTCKVMFVILDGLITCFDAPLVSLSRRCDK